MNEGQCGACPSPEATVKLKPYAAQKWDNRKKKQAVIMFRGQVENQGQIWGSTHYNG